MPLEGVIVELLNHSPRISAISNKEGKFELRQVAIGRQRVRIEMDKYYETIQSELVIAGKETFMTIMLEEKLEAIVEVTAKGKKRSGGLPRFRTDRLAAVNKMTTVSYRPFDVEEVTRFTGNLEDPARMITNFAGLYNIDDSQNYIVSRGMSPLGIAWMVEGIPLDNPHHFAVMSNTGGIFPILNTHQLAKSDFVNGAMMPEYNNAFSGVFDIKMRKGNNHKYEFTGEMSLWGIKGSVEGPIKKGGASFMLGYRYSLLSVIAAMGIDFGSNTTPTYQDLNFKIDIPTDKAGHFSIIGIGGLAETQFLAKDVTQNDIFVEQGINFHFMTQLGVLGIKHKKNLSKQTSIHTTLSYVYENSFTAKDTVPVPDSIVPYRTSKFMRHRAGVSSFINTKLSSKFVLRAGLNAYAYWFDVDSYVHRDARSWLYSRDLLYEVGAYVQMRYRFSDYFSIQGGVQGSYFSLNDNSWAVEPRIAINWNIKRRHQLSFGYGWHSRRTPLIVAFYVGKNRDNTLDYSNRELGYIRSHHGVISYNLYLAKYWGLKTNVYVQYTTDIPVDRHYGTFSLINTGASSKNPERANLVSNGDALSFGGEVSLEKFFGKGYYGVLTGSYFKSIYRGSDAIWRSTVYDIQYIAQLVAGKEFKIGKQKRNAVTLDLRVSHHGGSPYTPLDLTASRAAGTSVYDNTNPYSQRLNPYIRIDFKVGLRLNSKRTKLSHYVFLEGINIAMIRNDLEVKYDPYNDQVIRSRQVGLLPNLFYRIQF